MTRIRTAFAPNRTTARTAARSALAVAALLLAWLLPAAQSLAGTYRVDSCRVTSGTSAGSPAPLEVAETTAEAPGKWNRIASGEAEYANTCASGGSLTAALEAGKQHGTSDVLTLQFTSPRGETIANANVWRAGDADGGNGYMFWLTAPDNVSASAFLTSAMVFDGCAYAGGCPHGVGDPSEPLSAHNKIAVPGEDLHGSHLYMNVACSLETCTDDEGDEAGYAVVVHLYAAEMELEETASPVVDDVSGELASAGVLGGEANLAFHAEDAGSGVYEAIVEVDGEQLQRFVVDEAEGRCAPIGEAGGEPLTFLYSEPCPRTVEAHVSLDTTALGNGEHSLRVLVTNAAGNSTPVLERQIDVENGGEASEAGNETKTGTGEQGSNEGGSGEAGAGKDGSGEENSGKEGSGEGEDGSGGEAPQGEGPQAKQPAGGGTLGAGAAAGDALASGLADADEDLAASAGAANGEPASAAAKLAAHWIARKGAHRGGDTTLTIAYGRPATIAGTLTTATGAPIANAVVAASARAAYGGAGSAPMKAARTGKRGRFELELGKHVSSRTVELSYASTRGGKAVATTTLRLDVNADVRLRVSPKRTAAGETIRLSGKVLGGPIPHGGKQVVLEARSTGTRWLQFKVLRTNARGGFAATHRFRLPGPIRYGFRAVCPVEADFPFRAGASKAVSVWER